MCICNWRNVHLDNIPYGIPNYNLGYNEKLCNAEVYFEPQNIRKNYNIFKYHKVESIVLEFKVILILQFKIKVIMYLYLK